MSDESLAHSGASASIPGELVARLEADSAGSRELDALIWLRFNRPEYTGGVKALEMRGWYDGRGHMILETDAGEEVADDLGIGTYTTSLDAALALAERVLPGWGWSGGGLLKDGDRDAYARLDTPDGCDFEESYAQTPALALCIAILKATAASSVGTTEGRAPILSPETNEQTPVTQTGGL